MKKNQFLTIHGHFYQPPRENPWIESIERQESAAPFHDWNEKIAAQCYTPNSVSRILDHQGKIVDIVNNYKRISFNFGPTLMSWLEQKIPATYQAIIDADRESRITFNGHGNAIAQAYNHIILPLANYRDKVTQIKWGLADFEYRFNRKAEAIWLPETAINYETLSVLVEFSLRFVILSPFQAKRIAPLNFNPSEQWQDVSDGSIDVRHPYRCFLLDNNGKKDQTKYIDIFFYHGGLSNAVGFQHILRDAKIFADRIQQEFLNNDNNQLIAICTDGESYGHHEPFGDMALAYLLYVEAERRGLQLTNLSEFLAKNPPQWEVELKDGPKGEGTAWSCPHGVGRWYRDCGCSTGGQPGWNQKWRSYLRKAMDDLRDDLILLFEEQGAKYLKNVWDARNDYISVLLHRDDATIHKFLEIHGVSSSVIDDKVDILKLLECQRNAMLMYTSCGWFFSDISSIETIQILRYAAQAMELARHFGYDELEKKFLNTLQHARSNIPRHKDGATIYKNFVKTSIVTLPRVVNHFAILTSFKEFDSIRSVYHYKINPLDKEHFSYNNETCTIALIQMVSGITFEIAHYAYLLSHRGNLNFVNHVRFLAQPSEYDGLKSELKAMLCGSKSQMLQFIQQHWSEDQFTILDMLFEEREEFFGIMLREKMTRLHQIYQKVYYEHEELFPIMLNIGMPIPAELKIPAASTLSLLLMEAVEKSKQDFDRKFYKKALRIVEKAEKYRLQLDQHVPEHIFNTILCNRLNQLYLLPDLQNCSEIIEILEITRSLKLKIKEGDLQNIMFRILKEKLAPLLDNILTQNIVDERYQLVIGIIQLAYRLNFSTSRYKQKLAAIDKKLIEDPSIWP